MLQDAVREGALSRSVLPAEAFYLLRPSDIPSNSAWASVGAAQGGGKQTDQSSELDPSQRLVVCLCQEASIDR
jgi:hypothetical protein